MSNILEQEDYIKGLPDSELQRLAQQPDGQIPEFLTLSEINRRTEMRKNYEATEQPKMRSIASNIMAEGLASVSPQTPSAPPARFATELPMGGGTQGLGGMGVQGYNTGGVIKMNDGRRAPSVVDRYEKRRSTNIENAALERRAQEIYRQLPFRGTRNDSDRRAEAKRLAEEELNYSDRRYKAGELDSYISSGRAVDAYGDPNIESSATIEPIAVQQEKDNPFAQGLKSLFQLPDFGEMYTASKARDKAAEDFTVEDFMQQINMGEPSADQRSRFPEGASPYVVRDALSTGLNFLSDTGESIANEIENFSLVDPESPFNLLKARRDALELEYPDLSSGQIQSLLRSQDSGELPEEEIAEVSEQNESNGFMSDAEIESLLKLGGNTVDPITNEGLTDLLGFDPEAKSVFTPTVDTDNKKFMELREDQAAENALYTNSDVKKTNAVKTDSSRFINDLESIMKQGTAISDARATELQNLLETTRNQSQNDAFYGAMMRLGAGIAGGDMAGGLDAATTDVLARKKELRETELALGSEGRSIEQAELTSRAQNVSTMAALDLNERKLAAEIQANADLQSRDVTRQGVGARAVAEEMLSDVIFDTPEERAEAYVRYYNMATVGTDVAPISIQRKEPEGSSLETLEGNLSSGKYDM